MCSDVVVTTCHKSSTVGTKLCYDSGGHISSQSSSAREVGGLAAVASGELRPRVCVCVCVCVQVGTTVTLHRLFHTLPVRHKEFTRNLKKVSHFKCHMHDGCVCACTTALLSLPFP